MANYTNFNLRKFLAENKINSVEDVTPELEDQLKEELEITAEENLNEGLKDLLMKAIDKLFGLDKFNACMEAGWDSSEECKKIKLDMGYSKVKSGFEKSSGTTNVAEEETTELTKEEVFKKEIKNLLDS